MAHEALVRGVLEESAHQIGHARDELSHRGVDPEPGTEAAHGVVDGLCHPVEELDLVAVVGDARGAGPR